MIHLAIPLRMSRPLLALPCLFLLLGASLAPAQSDPSNASGPSGASSVQNQNAAGAKPKGIAASTSPAVPTKPTWAELNPDQQSALKPLASQWNSLSEPQKRKWIRISQNFSSLAEPEQAKLHSRMLGWVSLSPKERAQARLNFAETHRLSSAEKSSNWEAYQALSPDEKKQLAAQGPGKPAGASTPIRPIPPEKLSVVPVTKPDGRPTPKIGVNASAVQSNTLLPQVLLPSNTEPTEKN